MFFRRVQALLRLPFLKHARLKMGLNSSYLIREGFSPCYLGIGSIFVIKGNIQNIIRVNELIYKMGNSRWRFFLAIRWKKCLLCESRWCSLMWLGLSWPLNKRSCAWSTLVAPLPASQRFLVSPSCNAGWVHVMPMDNRSLFMWRCCKNELRVSCLSRWTTGEYGSELFEQ